MEIEKISFAALKTLEEAKKMNVPVCITVIDSGGHVVYQIRMEGATFITNEASYRKAKTAFLFKCPSHVLQKIVKKVPVLVHVIEQVPGDAIMIEGGLPIQIQNQFVGGVGVSGGNFEQDLALANAFIEILNEKQH